MGSGLVPIPPLPSSLLSSRLPPPSLPLRSPHSLPSTSCRFLLAGFFTPATLPLSTRHPPAAYSKHLHQRARSIT